MNIYTVQDLASKTSIKPFAFLTDRDAIEGFKHVCNDEKTPYAKHPADYNLCLIGSFNEQTGILKPSDPKIIARAINMIPQQLTKKEIEAELSRLQIELEEMQ